MKLVVLILVLMFGVFCSAALGDDWDSFDGNDSSSVGVNVNIGDPEDVVSDLDDYIEREKGKYTLEFYVALGVGAFGVLIVAIFVYFFLRKPKEKWAKSKSSRQ